MKKFRLLAIAFAAIFSSSSLFAQVDVTDMYITNPTLAQSASGWTFGKTGNGNNPATRTADVPVLEFYNAWSGNAGGSVAEQQFYLYQTVTLPAGSYRLELYGFYREGNGNGTNDNKAYVYAGEQQQLLEALTSANVSAYTGSDDLNKAANAFFIGDFKNTFDFNVAEAGSVELGVKGVINTYCSWCVVGGMKLYSFASDDALLNEAKDALGKKITEAENLLGTYSSTDAWYGDLNSAISTAKGKQNSSDIDEVKAAATALGDAMKVAEHAQEVVTKAAQVSAIINGGENVDLTSVIVNNGFESDLTGWDSNLAIQNNGEPIKVGSKYAEAWQPNGDKYAKQAIALPKGVYEFTVRKKSRGLASAEVFAGDNVTSMPLNDNVEDATVQFVLTEATELTVGARCKGTGAGSSWFAIDNFRLKYYFEEFSTLTGVSGKMNSSVATAQDEAIAAYNANKSLATFANASAAIENAEASIANYAAVTAKLNTLDAAGKAAFLATEVGQKYTDNTYVDEDCASAFATAAKAQGVGADMTLAIVNASFETGNLDPWTTTKGADTAVRGLSVGNTNYTNADGTYVFNTWNGSNASAPISQTIEGLKNGKYTVSAVMATDAGAKFYLSFNGTKGELADAVDLSTGVAVTVTGYVLDGTLTIEAGTEAGNWYKVDNFRMTYISEETVDPAVVEAQKLAAAKETKTAAINALAPVGSGIFQYSSGNVAAALQAVDAATTVAEVEAVALPIVNAPSTNKAYQLTSPNGNFIVINEGVKMADVQQPIYFAQNADGKFTISTNGNGNGTEYVVSVTSDGNYWSLTAAKGEGTAYSIVAADGGITIQAESKFFGFDNDEVGASLYRDKNATVFGIADYVEPKPVIADLTVNDGVAVAESQDAKNITYVREFKAANKWQSLYLPFSVNLENNDADVVLAKIDDVIEDNGELVIKIIKVSKYETVVARRPLFIAAKTVGVKNIKTGVSTIDEPLDGGYDYSAAEFIGVLSSAQSGYAGKYVMSGGELCLVPQSMNNLTLGVNRWAMYVNDGSSVRIRINAEGFSADEATAIASAVAESVENGEIFSINGAKVKDAKSGLYIKNGKKILVK